ncbi:putative GPI anchored cell wall protein [Aspergillus tanneri]|uniref:Extracellular membrane protein CFEM domain-containing protein n=1 Tax=Aspergillus tanneri TaxID=1220188 RepID=A0A5M9MX18_9EURO|nr:uncharacterized protein ATNIH1004_005064 [Aspergillus tanneri]KAA8649169.1 hypothetical protein ATNIH1004_005064 [Aspergillus tanneri]
MLFAKSTFLLSLFALSNIAAAAQSPACLISALGSEKTPGDLKAVCVDRVQKKIADVCGDDKQEALKQFADTCSAAGHKVVIHSTSSADSTSTRTSGGSKSTKTGTNTGFLSASATSTSDSSSNSGSSPSSASDGTQHTNSAGSSDKHVSAAAFAAVVFVGFAAAL